MIENVCARGWMMTDQSMRHDAWSAGDSYEAYMGRWSRSIAERFVLWLDLPPGRAWLELGCGTGALTSAILEHGAPGNVLATDRSVDFVAAARRRLRDSLRVQLEPADAMALALPQDSRDAVVSGLLVNFLPERDAALEGMARVVRPGGTLAFYVWDYPDGGVGFMHAFWQSAEALDPNAAALSEAKRFSFCTRDALEAWVRGIGCTEVASTSLVSSATFDSFEDLWRPFMLGSGPAPGYCVSLDDSTRAALRERLKAAVEADEDGKITMPLRAWAVRGTVSLR